MPNKPKDQAQEPRSTALKFVSRKDTDIIGSYVKTEASCLEDYLLGQTGAVLRVQEINKKWLYSPDKPKRERFFAEGGRLLPNKMSATQRNSRSWWML